MLLAMTVLIDLIRVSLSLYDVIGGRLIRTEGESCSAAMLRTFYSGTVSFVERAQPYSAM